MKKYHLPNLLKISINFFFFPFIILLLIFIFYSCDSFIQEPSEVSDLRAVSGDGLVTVAWTDPDDDNLLNIEITWTPNALASPTVVDSGVETTTITGLTNGQEYTFTLRAVYNEGIYSEGVTIKATPSAGDDFYVSSDGDDGNPGTLSQPWRTLQKAADTVPAGSAVNVRDGIYNEQVTINVSGSSASGFITFRNYNDEAPILDGTGLIVPDDNSGIFFIANRSYIIIQGFDIRNYQSSKSDVVPIGINIRGDSNHIEIRNNRIYNIETNADVDAGLSGADAHGIAVYGTDASASSNNIIIDGNELYNLKLGSSEALVVNGNVETFTISNNIIHDVNNIGIDVIGFEGTASDETFDQARNGIISSNTVYNLSSFGNPSYGDEYSAGGIYADGGKDTIIEKNIIYNADIGIEIASEHHNRVTSGITVRNNILYNNKLYGISMGGYDKLRGSTENCIILNNTLYKNDTLQDGNGEIGLNYDTRNNIIKNNIFYANEQSLFISNDFKENTDNVFDYNIYFSASGADGSEWVWKNVNYENFDEYKAATGNDVHSTFTDPEFVDLSVPDLHIKPGSPAIDSGDSIQQSGDRDIDDDDRVQGNGIDIGADENS